MSNARHDLRSRPARSPTPMPRSDAPKAIKDDVRSLSVFAVTTTTTVEKSSLPATIGSGSGCVWSAGA
jgi:hypothetical protein